MLASPHTLLEPDKVDALKYYKKATDNEDPEAYVAIADIYENGADGIQKNEKQAAQYYERAKELGSPEASVNLSRMHENGIHYKKNPNKAKELLIEAANNGSYIARSRLISTGIMPSIHVNDEQEDDEPNVSVPNQSGMYFPRQSPFHKPTSLFDSQAKGLGSGNMSGNKQINSKFGATTRTPYQHGENKDLEGSFSSNKKKSDYDKSDDNFDD